MKRKINRQFVLVAIVAIVACTVMMAFVFYNLIKRQVIDGLKINAEVIRSLNVLNETDIQNFDADTKQLRVTWIAKDGKVLYDNDANIGKMNNHSNRPEIVGALYEGEGEAVRKSDTLNKSTYYYAVRLSDGSVLRVAKEASNIWSIMQSVFPMMAIIIVIMILLCVLLAHILTRHLIRPIEKMAKNIDNYSYEPVYKELLPFTNTIREQHNDILKNAKMRQNFTANVSHELKTPLTSISGYAELMENGMAEGDDVIHFSSEIRQNANRLLVLINDIIRLSELDSMEDLVTLESVDLSIEMETCVKNLQVNAQRRGVSLHCEGDSMFVRANKDMLDEVIVNLCDNAIRYNKTGGSIWVSSRIEGDRAILSVKDNGIGIPEEHQKHVFERFYRVDKSRSKQTGGTGLGLSIVKHIAALNEAEIHLESKVGVGTTIEVSFELVEKSMN